MKSFVRNDAWARLLIIVAIIGVFVGLIKLLFDSKYQQVLVDRRTGLYQVTNDLDLQLNGRLKALKLLVAAPGIKNLDSRAIESELKRAVSVMGLFNAVVFDVNGNFLAEAVPEQHIGHVHDMACFAKAAAGEAVISGRIVYGELDAAYVSLRVPIYNDRGQVAGVLVAGLPISDVGEVIARHGLLVGEYFYIIDHNAKFVYHPHLAQIYPEGNTYTRYLASMFEQKNGELIGHSIYDGIEKLYIYTSLAKTDWRVVMAIPTAALYMAVIKAMLPNMIVFSLLFLTIGLCYRIQRQTQRYRAERENMRLERLTGISQLAAGIAHEIRNPLTAIKGFIQLLALKSGKPVQPDHLEIILTEIERIEKLTNEFKLLARPPQTPQYEPLDIVVLIRAIILLMQGQAADKDIKLSFQALPLSLPGTLLNYSIMLHNAYVPEDVYRVNGDSGQLKQVLINLLRNAIEATGEGGSIQITVSESDKHIVVAIQDTGAGISEGNLTKIGTPFFTTKENGTGLGLSVCYNIIEQHGGKMKVTSKLGVGTAFSLLLPTA